jgi:Aerotolerance regulator N-terminal
MEFIRQNMLWGLLGLGIPILIHLLNKKNKNQVFWAATAFLQKNQPPKSRSFVPKDILLLILRCLILGLICAILAVPLFSFFSKNTNKTIRFFEKSSEIQSQFKFELQNAKNEAYFFSKEQEQISDLNSSWINGKKLSQKETQSIINQICKDFDPSDTIQIFIRPAIDFYKAPYLFIPKNIQINWGKADIENKIPVWKSGNLFFDESGKMEKFDTEKHRIVFEKDSLKICVNTSSQKYILDALEAIKRVYKYPIGIQNDDKNSDLVIGSSQNSNIPNIQLGAFKSGIQPLTNVHTIISSPLDKMQSSIRMGTYPEIILAKVQSFVGLDNTSQEPTLVELNESIKSRNFEFGKSKNLDLRYLWFLVILLICFERFLSIKYSK